MEQNRDVQVALAHEFWCCRREFDSFALHATLLLRENTRELRLSAFTAYGNCIRHLYTFYEGIIKLRNPELIAGVKKHEIGEKISELMYQEARKLVRNKIAVYNSRPDLDTWDIAHFINSEVPPEFGTDFRQMRNRFSHAAISRVNKDGLTLNDFFRKYHKYILLMYQSCALTWNIKDIEQYDWQEIDEFFNVVNSSTV